MTGSDRGGPRPVGDLLGDLFAARGFGRLRAAGELALAWEQAVGQAAAPATKVGGVRHGVLTVIVAHSALLEELSAFRKSELLANLRQNAPTANIHDIRFRVGPVDPAPNPPSKRGSR